MNMRLLLSLPLVVLSSWVNAGTSVTTTSALGLLVDSANAQLAQTGLPVLGATPGSLADRLGLRPGDVVIEVNGTALGGLGADADGRALAAVTFKSTVAALPASVPLRLRVLRNGMTVAMNAPLHDANAEADMSPVDRQSTTQGCGRISTFDVAPRSAQQYHATIVLLDGVTPGPTGHETYRVGAGTHELLVAEDIPTDRMGVGSIASLRTRRDNSKRLTIHVKADTTVMVAAQLHADKASHFANAAYWDPVVWREIDERCP
jgi:hypothetical protein